MLKTLYTKIKKTSILKYSELKKLIDNIKLDSFFLKVAKKQLYTSLIEIHRLIFTT